MYSDGVQMGEDNLLIRDHDRAFLPSQIKDGGDATEILIAEKGKKRQGEL